MGGKFYTAKHILPIILKDRQEGQWYVEPFCGGCNTLSEVTGNRIGADTHCALIGMWLSVSYGWLPPESISLDEYTHLKQSKDLPHVGSVNPLVGYVGFVMSFAGKYFGGYAKNNESNRDYAGQAAKSAQRQFPKLRNVIFKNCSYEDLKIPERSIIYCDPPYAGTTKYEGKRFDSLQFWEQVRNWVFDGHKVFVSEYRAPSDFVSIWSKEKKVVVKNTKDTQPLALEKLFVHRSQYNE